VLGLVDVPGCPRPVSTSLDRQKPEEHHEAEWPDHGSSRERIFMEIVGNSLDDVLIELYKKLLTEGSENRGSRGDTIELLGVTLRVLRPRARLSRSEDRGKPFSAVGELLWYLSGSDRLEFIKPYIGRYEDDAVDGILQGAYGPRLFRKNGSINQVENVIALLSQKPGSRRAVIQFFDAEDIAIEKKEIPCTTALQFHLRDGALHMSATMRSNDAYWGLPHDIFCFTMLQEMISRRLGADLGTYIHHVGSMHLYDKYIDAARQYMEEGHQRPNEMPEMPRGDTFLVVPALLDAEVRIRNGEAFGAEDMIEGQYWSDIARLLQVHWARRRGEDLSGLRSAFVSPVYLPFVNQRPTPASSGAQVVSEGAPK
jgi:thymidylate synthase